MAPACMNLISAIESAPLLDDIIKVPSIDTSLGSQDASENATAPGALPVVADVPLTSYRSD